MVLLYIAHIIVCLFLILVVLLQQGKGADLSVFGGGSTQAAFGARSATTLLHKLSVVAFVSFIVTTLAIGLLQGRGDLRSVTSGFEDDAAAAAATTEEAVDGAIDAATDAAADTVDAAGAETPSVDGGTDSPADTATEADGGTPTGAETPGADDSNPDS